jgi:sarcosine/dimethylglycine N-methyltransferase
MSDQQNKPIAGKFVVEADRQAVARHYQSSLSTEELILRIGRTSGSNQPAALNAAQLASLDQFHVRGLAATADLARMVGLNARARVLDVGSGLGGPSRFLAETYGCRVTGVDLSDSFVSLSRALAEMTPAASLVDYAVGDLTALSFPDASFDVVWTQHALMNVRNREGAYREISRVLAPRGQFVFHDIVATEPRTELEYPLPWASGPALNHLLTQDETRSALAQTGFEEVAWIDDTVATLEWFKQAAPRPDGAPTGTSPVTLGAVVGSAFPTATSNLLKMLREGRVSVTLGVFYR